MSISVMRRTNMREWKSLSTIAYEFSEVASDADPGFSTSSYTAIVKQQLRCTALCVVKFAGALIPSALSRYQFSIREWQTAAQGRL